MKKTLLKKNIFLVLIAVFFAGPVVANAQYGTDWGYTDYGTDWGYTDYGTDWGYTDYGSNWGYTDYGTDWGYTDYGTDWGYTDYGTDWGYTDYGSNWGYTDYGTDWGYTDYGTDWGYTDYGTNWNVDPYYEPYYDEPYYEPYYGGYAYNYGDYGYDYNYGQGGYDYCNDCYSYNPPCYNDCYEPPRRDDLDVECVANPRNAEEGERVTWRAYVDGGDGRYTYSWSEDVSGNSEVEYETYNREDRYYGTVRVRSGDGQTATARCSVDVEEDSRDDLDVRCEYSPSRPEEGDRVTFRADVDGGDSPYDYDWSGDISGDDRTVSKRFNRAGRYEVEIEVRDDDGDRATDTCSFRIYDEDDDDDTNVNITSTPSLPTPTGTPASLSSVYLSQVPYTGPEDVLKFSLWGIALALFSFIAVREYKKYSYNKMKKNRIEAFKEENKSKIGA